MGGHYSKGLQATTNAFWVLLLYCRCFKPRCHRSVLQELKKEVNELEETIPVPATSMCPPEAGKVGNQQQGWSGIKSEHLELDLDSMSDHDGEATPHYSEPAPCNMFI